MIGYVTQGGETVVAIFGGLTRQQAESGTLTNGPLFRFAIPQSDADRYGNGDMFKSPMRPAYRVVLWPSELQRRAALVPVRALDTALAPHRSTPGPWDEVIRTGDGGEIVISYPMRRAA